MFDDFLEFVRFAAAPFLFLALFVGGLIAGIAAIEGRACRIYGETTGHRTVWVWPSDCYIEHNGEMVHWELIQRQAIAKDGLERSN